MFTGVCDLFDEKLKNYGSGKYRHERCRIRKQNSMRKNVDC